MIFHRIQRGATRTKLLVGNKLESIVHKPNRFTTSNVIRKVAFYSLALRVITLPIPVQAVTVPGNAAADDTDPSPTVPFQPAEVVVPDVTFSPLALRDQNAQPFAQTSYSLPTIAVGKSYRTENEEHERELQIQRAREEAERKAAEEQRIREEEAQKREAARKAAEEKRAAATTKAVAAPSGDAIREMAYQKVAERFGADQWASFQTLANRESGFNPSALNKRSGACGIPQALPCSKLPQGINTPAESQIDWMLGYIAKRYGNPDAALSFSNRNGYY